MKLYVLEFFLKMFPQIPGDTYEDGVIWACSTALTILVLYAALRMGVTTTYAYLCRYYLPSEREAYKDGRHDWLDRIYALHDFMGCVGLLHCDGT